MQKIVLIITLCFINVLNAGNIEHDSSVTIKLLHALTPNEFSERGNISIPSLRLAQSILHQNPLSTEEGNKLRDLANKNDFYQIKSTVFTTDGKETTFLSTVKACMLAESELDDRISVSLDYTGRVIGVTLIIASKSTCEGADVPLSKLKQFTTTVYVRHSETGIVPDTATYIQKVERERDAKEKGAQKDNRSFIAKYWMYIVPVVIVMMIMSTTNPEAAAATR